MKNFIDWVFCNWQFLSCIIVLVINCFLVLFKKRIKVVDSVLNNVVSYLPCLISMAEGLFPSGHGSEKFSIVFGSAISLICELSGLDEEQAFSKYGDILKSQIENILICPKSKGGK